jgi:hypothetical protein
MRFEVSSVLTLKVKVFWVATLGSRVTDSQCSTGRYWLHLRGLRSPRRTARTRELLKMKDVCSCKMSQINNPVTLHTNPEDLNPQ